MRKMERDYLQDHNDSKQSSNSRLRKLFAVNMVRHWDRLPRKAADAPSLEVFKAGLEGSDVASLRQKGLYPVVHHDGSEGL